ncbi:MAG: response regulator [Lachnospiraceae bacterium]|nr:response regulator [Lachnospiraceae bacterium]
MLNLLIVDDEKMTRDTLLSQIPWESMSISQVRTARNGLDALDVCHDFTPDICLCDVKMPKMNGIQLGYSLRDKFPSCKIIYLSGYCDKDDLKSAIEIGAVSYIEKPISFSNVKEVVNRTVACILTEKRLQEQQQEEKELLKKLRAQFTDEEIEELSSEKKRGQRERLTTANPVVNRAIDYIYEHFSMAELSIGEIADNLFLNKSYLCTLFKKETGSTINVFLTDVRMQEAEHLMQETDLPIYEIAYRVGINDPNYFSTLFKKCVGCAPSDYKENHTA